MKKTAYILSNLGTPKAPTAKEVGVYLKEFLTDPMVIPLPAPVRHLLVRGLIVPRRAPKSAEKYAAIWTEQGSPLLVHSRSLLEEMRAAYPNELFLLGMRYGEPSIPKAVSEAKRLGAERLVLVPLYPQFADATSGSTWSYMRSVVKQENFAGTVELFPAFPIAPFFVKPSADRIAPFLKADSHLLLTFHGLPVKQLKGEGCKACDACCAVAPPNFSCYRAHCLASARAIAAALNLPSDRWTLGFQSRFGSAKWIGPHTEDLLREFPKRGIKNLVVAAPSFVADCLETLEELGIQGQEIFRHAGGEHYDLAPCLNEDANFARGLGETLCRF